VRRAAVSILVLCAALSAPSVASPRDPVTTLGLIRPNPARPAKDFQVPDLGQRPLRLSEYRGKVVFLNFWATWCKPCEAEMPSMERLWQRYRDRGLVVLAVSTDADPALVARFVKKYALTFPVGVDRDMQAANLYGVWALPSTFIVDKQGNRALFANGPREWDGPAAVALFDALVKAGER
jgi:peroxiredoxin